MSSTTVNQASLQYQSDVICIWSLHGLYVLVPHHAITVSNVRVEMEGGQSVYLTCTCVIVLMLDILQQYCPRFANLKMN